MENKHCTGQGCFIKKQTDRAIVSGLQGLVWLRRGCVLYSLLFPPQEYYPLLNKTPLLHAWGTQGRTGDQVAQQWPRLVQGHSKGQCD